MPTDTPARCGSHSPIDRMAVRLDLGRTLCGKVAGVSDMVSFAAAAY